MSTKEYLKTFWLGPTGGTLHMLVSVTDDMSVEQRAACGSKLLEMEEPIVPYDLYTTALQLKKYNKKVCGRCVRGNQDLLAELEHVRKNPSTG